MRLKVSEMNYVVGLKADDRTCSNFSEVFTFSLLTFLILTVNNVDIKHAIAFHVFFPILSSFSFCQFPFITLYLNFIETVFFHFYRETNL